MTLDEKLFEEIRNDLLNDFPNIKKINREGNIITINADTDTLWDIYETLHKGTNIELNLDSKEDAYITINF